MAADSAATLGAMGNNTVQQRTVRKLHILHDKILLGQSGFVGLSQRTKAALDVRYADGGFCGSAEETMQELRQLFWNVVSPEYAIAKQAQGLMPAQVAAAGAMSSMLLALPLRDKFELMTFDHLCAPELSTDELPFAAIGSGQPIADSFLAFIRKVFWPPGKAPTLNDGIFSAVWALQHTIESIPGGVAPPIRVMTLVQKNDGWAVTEIPDGDIEQHMEAIKDAERSLMNWRSQFTAAPSGKPPEPLPTIKIERIGHQATPIPTEETGMS